MRQELVNLLDNCYSEIDQFKCCCISVMNDGKKFRGVNIKNSVYRDSLYAEVASIVSAVSCGYRKGDFESIHILANNDNYNICKEIIKEFFEDNKKIYIYTLSSEDITKIEVKDL